MIFTFIGFLLLLEMESGLSFFTAKSATLLVNAADPLFAQPVGSSAVAGVEGFDCAFWGIPPGLLFEVGGTSPGSGVRVRLEVRKFLKNRLVF